MISPRSTQLSAGSILARMRGLYAIADADHSTKCGVELVDLARAILAGHPAVLQIRAKHLDSRALLEVLRAVLPLSRAAQVPLFANDRPDLAVLAGCEGVHVGQEDVPVSEVRRFAPGLRVGVSTHDLAQLEREIVARPDYVAFGPVFATGSKERPDPVVGLERLAEAARRVDGRVPLVAIGGIGPEHIQDVARHADAVAVISALVPREGLVGVTERVRTLARLIATARP
jgi:thiamine-phosphate pyrophosphorylase